jgi:inhibitor of cysteine peptidase
MPSSTIRRPRASRRNAAAAVTAVAAALAIAPAAQAKTVTVKTTGKSVNLKVGDKLVVSVAENPSTGYAWKTTAKPSFLKLLTSKYTANPVASGVVGGGGRRVLTYKATKKGSGTLKLVYRRSFAPSADDQKFTVKVTVK